MKIVHLALDNFFIDGYSYQENLLVKYHKLMGNDVTMIASLRSFGADGKRCFLKNESEYYDSLGIKIIRLAYKRPTLLSKAIRQYVGLAKRLEQESPDIIFSHNLGFKDTKIVANYLTHHPEVKFFCDDHIDYVNYGNNWIVRKLLNCGIRARYARRMIPFITKCFGVTPMRCRFVKEVYKMPDHLIEFLPMGVDDKSIPTDRIGTRNKIRNELGIKEDELVIFTGGKIDRLKNTHVLLDSIKQLNSPHVHLIICGVITSEMEELNEVIKGMPNIHALGWCKADRVMECMVASDIACFPGTHSTLWEQAVGVGLPIIVKRWHEIEHININGNCTFVKGEDAEELTDAIRNTLVPSHLKELKKLCYEARKEFLYSEIAKKAIGL